MTLGKEPFQVRRAFGLFGLVLACTVTVPPTTPTAPAAAPSPAAASPTGGASDGSCNEARQAELLRSFFDGYQARNAVRVAAAFHDPGSGGFQYYDSVDGEAVDLRHRDALAAYLERRWALDDRFDVDVGTIGLSGRFTNPTFSFGRSSVQGSYFGNAKFVCSGGRFSALITSSVATTRSECPETTAASGLPSNSNTAAFSRRWYASADRKMWASKPERFYVRGNKVLWERPTGQQLHVTGHPRGAPDVSLNASIPAGYETLDYQASGIDFPLAGCWDISATAGSSQLNVTVEVSPETYLPPTGGCEDMESLVAASRWIVIGRVEASKPDRPGYVQHEIAVRQSWKGESASADHRIALWQDALYEPVLESGRTYSLFLGTASFGSPEVRYGLTRIICPLRTIIEIRDQDLVRPPQYSEEAWIWQGPARLAALQSELTRYLPTR